MLVIALVIWIAASTTAAQTDTIPAKLPPVDEASQDPALQLVRDTLLRAAKAGDLATVWRFIDPDIQTTWDNKRGVDRLKRQWQIDRSSKRFLIELSTVLSLGGRFEYPEHRVFVAPSMFLDFPDPVEMPSHAVAIRRRAPVYAHPAVTGDVLAHLNNDVVRIQVAFKGWTQGWVMVTLADKRVGYMRQRDIRVPSDTRAYFSRVRGRWILTGFYGGID